MRRSERCSTTCHCWRTCRGASGRWWPSACGLKNSATGSSLLRRVISATPFMSSSPVRPARAKAIRVHSSFDKLRFVRGRRGRADHQGRWRRPRAAGCRRRLRGASAAQRRATAGARFNWLANHGSTCVPLPLCASYWKTLQQGIPRYKPRCRQVSITAVGPVTCCVIGRADFRKVLGPMAQFMKFTRYDS